MHPIASILQGLNNTDLDNVQFLARIVSQNSLPKNHRFYHPMGTRTMIKYLPNKYNTNLECYDFMETCKIPSNCYHTTTILGEFLPQNIIDHYEYEKNEIRPKGRYIIVTYILKRKLQENKVVEKKEDSSKKRRFEETDTGYDEDCM